MIIKSKIQRLFSAIVTVVILAITILFMFISIMIGGFYVAYHYMINQGLNAGPAAFITLLLALILLFITALIISKRLDRLSKPTSFEAIIEGFFNGLHMGHKPRI